MYLPAYFREDRVEVLHALIRQYPLATLVTAGPEGLTANHLPMLIDPEPTPYGTLTGHLARGNSQWRAAGEPALVIFAGPDHYISPNWYPTKQEHGKVVPTWNYATVHAHGILQAHEDRDWLRSFVTRLTATHESQFEQPWHVTDAPSDYIDGLLKGIVGVEIRIEKLEGKWKMSQNRSDADRQSSAAALEQIETPSAAEVSKLMAQSKR